MAVPYIEEVLECTLVALSNKVGGTAVVLKSGEPEGFDTLLAARLIRSRVRKRFGVFVVLERLLCAGFELFPRGLRGAVDDRDTAIVQWGEHCEVLLKRSIVVR